ncbi:MAG: radical SAM protein [Verrucomicrobiales bacterium]|nr:radical SAM protein [Verrucomicrobiales bacterium]
MSDSASIKFPPLSTQRRLKATTSRCPVCLQPCPAEVLQVGESPGKVYLRRACATHGEATVCLASDARFYWLAQGDPANAQCGCGGGACRASDGQRAGTLGKNAAGRGSEAFESLATCLALIEVVDSCNLRCPTCYSESPHGIDGQVKAPSLEDLQARIQGVIDRKGPIEILQLSGGEPTLHPRFFELLDWVAGHPKIQYLLLNTNGVRFAVDPSFVDQFRTRVRVGKMQVYLQFDGPQEAGQQALRGADLRGCREAAIQSCGRLGLPVTLAMTVTRQNLGSIWAAIEFGLRWPHIRGVSFQPEFLSGRNLHGPASIPALRRLPLLGGERTPRSTEEIPTPDRLGTADIILAAVEQSGGRLRFEDFTPLPCGDPNCATIGYLLKVAGQIRSISDFVDFTQVQGFLRDKVRYQPEDLARCGCESEPLADLLKQYEMDASNTFRLFIKPFMDAWTWDQDRIDRCCTHVIRPDGRLDSFCRYYSGFAEAKSAP